MKCIQVKADGTTCGRESGQSVCPECWGPRCVEFPAAPEEMCRFKGKQGLEAEWWTPYVCTNKAAVRGLCPYHAAEKCDGCGGQAVRACPADGCFKALCDNCTHIVSGVHAPPAKGCEPVRCNYGIDDPKPRLRHCFKTALEASVYCEDHQPPAPIATASRRIQDLETLLASERAALAEARKRIEAMNAKQAEAEKKRDAEEAQRFRNSFDLPAKNEVTIADNKFGEIEIVGSESTLHITSLHRAQAIIRTTVGGRRITIEVEAQ